MVRNLVSIKTIDAINPIPDADAIEAAALGGWTVVVKKNEFRVGESVLYFEIDSFLPSTVKDFEFLLTRGTKTAVSPYTNDEVVGHVLRTARLRGVISQGLVLPLNWGIDDETRQETVDSIMEDLGVFKWEPPVPAGGGAIAPFPSEARKTDSERVQNLNPDFFQMLNRDDWVATEKIDGTSATFVKTEGGEFFMCSRNWVLDPTQKHAHAAIAAKYNFDSQMPLGSIIQGEIFGEGIQGNPLKIQGIQFRVFSTQGIEASTELGRQIEEIRVPTLDWTLPPTIVEAVDQANKMVSSINPKVQAEGVIWWDKSGTDHPELEYRPNFKAINNQFLLKNGG